MKTPILICGSIISLCLFGCNPQESTQTTTAQSSQPTTTTATVKQQDLTGYSYFSGRLVIPSTAEASAYSPYATSVEAVSTTLGKYVGRGQQIVRLRIPGVDQAATQARVDLSAAKANYSSQKADASGPVQQAQQALDQAKQEEQVAKDTVASGGTADVQAATQAVEQAEANLAAAKQQLNQSLQPTKEALAQSAAELSAVREDARKGIVRAPISGTVVSLSATPGMQTNSNQMLASIVDYAQTHVEGVVPPELKDEVTRGSSVVISFDNSTSLPVNGVVSEVTVIPPSQGQPSPGYNATIRFTDPRALAKTNTSGIARIGVRTGSVKNALVVPMGAILQENGKAYVKVQKGGSWTEVPVVTGISDGAVIEIKSGLQQGDVVQVQGQAVAAP